MHALAVFQADVYRWCVVVLVLDYLLKSIVTQSTTLLERNGGLGCRCYSFYRSSRIVQYDATDQIQMHVTRATAVRRTLGIRVQVGCCAMNTAGWCR